jgi:hypothetical protein
VSEHFDPNETLTLTCERCGKTIGGWDEGEGWNEVTTYDEAGLEVASEICCPECEPLWKDETEWES